ncbi:glycosyltransferase family 4 protein, partial [Candidatus Sumerlaeota bacterium]|nr:glycosyltransferase family 4 protein [Candidatus Sumerlaeota bacterium]
GITGRLRDEKGHKYLFDALPRIIEAAPDFVLLVVGAGSLEDELKAQVARLGAAEHVIFTGFRTDIPKFLAAFDLFVMPSISEGLGTAIIEAAMAGLPIVATQVGGIPDIIESGESGLLVPPADPAALAEAMVRMYREREFAARCGRAALDHARGNFSEQTLVEKTERVYLEWMARARNEGIPGKSYKP